VIQVVEKLHEVDFMLYCMQRKRLEEQYEDSQFMVVIHTDRTSEHNREHAKLESNDGTMGPSCIIEDAPNTTGRKRKERTVNGEGVKTGLVGSQETSGTDTSGKKRGKTSEKKKKKRKLDEGAVTILPETSVDRSARETEELYLKLENSNRDFWLQDSVSSLKIEEEKKENRTSPAANSPGIEAAEGEDVAQSRLEGGVAQIDDTDNNKVKVMSDTPVLGGNAADSHLSLDLCAGTTEASDREGDDFLSQGRGVKKLVRNYMLD